MAAHFERTGTIETQQKLNGGIAFYCAVLRHRSVLHVSAVPLFRISQLAARSAHPFFSIPHKFGCPRIFVCLLEHRASRPCKKTQVTAGATSLKEDIAPQLVLDNAVLLVGFSAHGPAPVVH